MNKTDDIEAAISFALRDGALTLDEMQRRLPDPLQDEDPRWIGAAFYKMLGAGRLRMLGCAPEHNHGGDCVMLRADTQATR